jgi:flavin-dependent dehydrogenase
LSVETRDALVIGGGPAGALAARLLAVRGLDTLLVDRATFPRDKVCGCTLNGRALAALARAGLRDLPTRLGAVPLRELILMHRGRRSVVPLEQHVALSRTRLDAALLDAAAAAGATIRTATLALEKPDPSAMNAIVLRNVSSGATAICHARSVIAAGGLGSRALGAPLVAEDSRAGAAAILVADGADNPLDEHTRGRLTLALGRRGYAGIVRLEDDRLDVALAFEPGDEPRAATLRILAEAGLAPIAALHDAEFHGVPRLTRRPAVVARDAIFAIGDAAGYVEPFTGEGVAAALESAALAAPFVAARIAGDRAAADHYALAHRAHFAADRRACARLATLLRHPHLVGAATRTLALAPALAGWLTRPLLARYEAKA